MTWGVDKSDFPKYYDFHWPTLCALRALGGSGSNSEIDEEVARREGYSEEMQSVLHNDGPQTELGFRLNWARSYLKGMGLADNPHRAFWTLTPLGQTVGEGALPTLRNEYHQRLTDARAKRANDAVVDDGQDGVVDDGQNEVVDDGQSDHESEWQDQLLEALLDMAPDAFERLCQRLLREAGFSRTEVTGRTGDGGIDGTGVYRVSLVSFPVFFQSKRWRNSVGAKEVRDFRGAMAGRGEKGLLITTSTFTSEAKAEASRDGAPPVDLVDGETLCELLADHEIGVKVQVRQVKYVTVDLDALKSI